MANLDFEDLDKMKKEKSMQTYYNTLLVAAILIFILFSNIFDIGVVDGNSMNNTLMDGNVEISINKRFCKINRGDIINIDSAVLCDSIVKRVIAVEGDTVVIKDGKVYVNSEELIEDYLMETAEYEKELVLEVPKGHLFVMGDNRNNSTDSRKIGCIAMGEVRSKLIFWLD